MATTPLAGPTLTLDHATLGQLAYHLRCSAGLTCSGGTDESAAHALLGWALIETIGGEELDLAMAALDLPDRVGDLSAPGGRHILAQAQQLALQLVAHFVSDGRHDLAGLYQGAFDRITTVARPA